MRSVLFIALLLSAAAFAAGLVQTIDNRQDLSLPPPLDDGTLTPRVDARPVWIWGLPKPRAGS